MHRYGRRQWHPTPVLLPGKSHGQRSLVGCSPWGRKESDTTERLHFDFSLSCIGEGNCNPLQCSCLENPRDGGAWWAAVYGVAQSWTRLKRLSSSSSKWLGKLFTGTGCCLAEIFMDAGVRLSLCDAFWGVQGFLGVRRLPCGFMSQRSHRWAWNPGRTQGRRGWPEVQRPVLQKADLKLSNSAVGAFAF